MKAASKLKLLKISLLAKGSGKSKVKKVKGSLLNHKSHEAEMQNLEKELQKKQFISARCWTRCQF
jgi:AICAR transformylase/IMP cyclohydrolase PurH